MRPVGVSKVESMGRMRSIVGWLDNTGVPLLLIRLLVGGAFVYMAIMKLLGEPRVFQKAIKMYNVLPLDPPELVNATAIVVPWLELICGLALLAGVLVRGASLLIFLMLSVFTPALYMITIKLLNEGRYETFCDVKFDCGCGTGEEWMCTKIPINIGLAVLALLGLLSNSRKFCLSSRLWNRRKKPPEAPPESTPAETAPAQT